MTLKRAKDHEFAESTPPGGVDYEVENGRMNGDLAIRLRAVVKHYGEITAVAGLDLDVPTGTCVGLLGPNGAGKSTTMRMLTGQTIADEGEESRCSGSGCRTSRSRLARSSESPAARQPRCDADRRAEPSRLRTCRIGRSERREAIERALAMANLADHRRRRNDSRGGMRRRLLGSDPSFTVPGSCCSTSRRSASIRRSARSSGR